LPPSLALLAPTFPTFGALVTLSEDRPEARPKREGLYHSLLGDPQPILQDLLANPQKYEPGVAELVQDLASSRKKTNELSTREVELLDRATIDFSQPTRRKPVEQAPVQPKKTVTPSLRYNEPKDSPDLAGMDPYWWLK